MDDTELERSDMWKPKVLQTGAVAFYGVLLTKFSVSKTEMTSVDGAIADITGGEKGPSGSCQIV